MQRAQGKPALRNVQAFACISIAVLQHVPSIAPAYPCAGSVSHVLLSSQEKIGKIRQQQGLSVHSTLHRLSPVDKGREGFLVKRAIKSGRNWKKRFCVLRVDSLLYATDEFHTAKVRLDLSAACHSLRLPYFNLVCPCSPLCLCPAA